MSQFTFDGKNHGGKITGIDVVLRNTFKNNKPKNLDKILSWLLSRRMKQGNIKSVVITTLQKRQRKECLTRR